MTNNRGYNWLRSITSICLIAIVFTSTSMVALAVPGGSLSGEIIVSGNDSSAVGSAVTLNGEPILSGRTFLSSGVISTPAARSATINLGKLGRVSLSPASTLSLSLAENSISAILSTGEIKISSNEGVSLNIQTPDDLMTCDPSQAGSFTISFRSGKTLVTAERGSARMSSGTIVSAQTDDDDDDDTSSAGLWIYAAIVGGAVAYILIKDNDDDENRILSPVS